jgi:hypothetical protein
MQSGCQRNERAKSLILLETWIMNVSGRADLFLGIILAFVYAGGNGMIV